VKKKHFIFIIQNNSKNRKHKEIKNKKDKSLKKKLKHELNIFEITHLCIRHWVQTSKFYRVFVIRLAQGQGLLNTFQNRVG
jgi:hypothetical protein